MMRSPRCLTVAVRRRNQAIVLMEQPWVSRVPEWVRKVPFLRGSVVLFESMRNGYGALRFSADQFEQDLPEDERGSVSEGEGSSGMAARLGIVMSLGLMVALPKLLAWGTGHVFAGGLTMADPRFHILAGLFKLLIVVGMMLSMRKSPEMYRVFQYHGAEHKAIAVHEAGLPLTAENARQFSTRHARCGTTFLMVVVLVSVGVFATVLPAILPHSSGFLTMIASIFLSIPLLPPIAGVAYELQRLGARYADHPLAQLFLGPGFLVQRITTAEPTDDQVEVAMVALSRALAREAETAASSEAPSDQPLVQTFPSYAAFAALPAGR